MIHLKQSGYLALVALFCGSFLACSDEIDVESPLEQVGEMVCDESSTGQDTQFNPQIRVELLVGKRSHVDIYCPEHGTPFDIQKLFAVGICPVELALYNDGPETIAIQQSPLPTLQIDEQQLLTLCSRVPAITTGSLSLDTLVVAGMSLPIFCYGLQLDTLLEYCVGRIITLPTVPQPTWGRAAITALCAFGYYGSIRRYKKQLSTCIGQIINRQKFNNPLIFAPHSSKKLLYFIDMSSFSGSICLGVLPVVDGCVGDEKGFVRACLELNLGGVQEMRKKIDALRAPVDVKKELYAEIDRIEGLLPFSQEASVMNARLETILALPWGTYCKESSSLKAAHAILDKSHYGMGDVKEQVLDVLAVRMTNKRANPPIICLVGPPGIGKTSLALSIAKSLNRPFARVSVGGVHEEGEIRGHRVTFVGAMPGRFVQALKNVGVSNPVILIDEIDKMGSGNSDAARAALLEILDPEQNSAFQDHYVGVPFDFSQVLFVTTANNIYDIPYPLIDRMQIIEVGSYTLTEKVKIAQDHLITKAFKETGLSTDMVLFKDDVADIIRFIVLHYTYEAGVRNLYRTIKTVCSKIARIRLETGNVVELDIQKIETFLGVPRLVEGVDSATNHVDTVGVVHGLAWTGVGGSVLKIQIVTMPGTGGLSLTGQLGTVMKESAYTALSYVRAHAEQLQIPDAAFAAYDVHIHVTGTMPKEGPSAGAAITTALVSAFTKRPIKASFGMTGEIDLCGNVLPIGGLKGKALAAKHYGLTSIIAPSKNSKDLEQCPEAMTGITFHWVDTMDKVFELILGPVQAQDYKNDQA